MNVEQKIASEYLDTSGGDPVVALEKLRTNQAVFHQGDHEVHQRFDKVRALIIALALVSIAGCGGAGGFLQSRPSSNVHTGALGAPEFTNHIPVGN